MGDNILDDNTSLRQIEQERLYKELILLRLSLRLLEFSRFQKEVEIKNRQFRMTSQNNVLCKDSK